MLARWEVRRRWRSTVALALLIGAVGALVLATAAGARRSDTALSRFNAYSRSANLEVSVSASTPEQLARLRATSGIAAVAVIRGYALVPVGAPDLGVGAAVDGAMGNVVDRPRLIAGRFADPAATDEIALGEEYAKQLHVRVGGHVDCFTYTPEQKNKAFAGGDPGPPLGPRLRLRIVGLVRLPLDLGDRAASGGVVVLTPGFDRKYRHRIGVWAEGLRVRTTTGAAGVPRAVAAARNVLGDDQLFDTQALNIEAEGARNAIDVLTLALWIFAGVAAVAGFVAIGTVLSRDVAQVDLDQATLRALGFTRHQRIAARAPRALLVASGGALIAGLGAVAASPWFPVGVARRADPDPGLHADWTVLGLGIPFVLALVLTIAFVAARRATRGAAFESAPRVHGRTSRVAALAAGAGMRPSVTNGLRMATQSSGGETAVPVRSAFAGAVAGVAGVAAVIVFAASLGHLVATPRLVGWNWDLKGEVPTQNLCLDHADHGLARTKGIEAIAAVCFVNIQIDDHPVTAWSFEPVRGVIDPEIVAGRAPRGRSETALGSATLKSLHKRIGDMVTAVGPMGTRHYEIVGRVVLPAIGGPQPLADGASFTSDGLVPILDRSGGNQTHFLVARFAPGVDGAAVARKVAALPYFSNVGRAAIPVEVDHLRQVDWLPIALAVLLGGLALIAVAHALVTGVRRRRRELALFKIVGFDRRQVRATVAWHATTLATVGLVVGIPIGIVVGRVVWRLVADSLGVENRATIPALALALTVPCALAIVNLVAFLPARAAAQTRPAVALRSE